MMFSRRGFLQTLAAAAVGAATFDPKSLLWVPAAPPPIVSIELAGLKAGKNTAAALVIEQHAELNDLALRFARMMTERLERHPSVVLREVTFRLAGTVQLGVLDIPEVGRGRLRIPRGRLLSATTEYPRFTRDHHGVLSEMAGSMTGLTYGLDMFAPLGADLRPGEPFDPDTAVGIATDPESGLSVRVTRNRHDHVRHRSDIVTMFEMAGGNFDQRQV